jgi:signal recognition particle subunit SRP19
MKPEKFIVVYPSYLDSTKTVKEGRRISKELAIPTPTVGDMSQALQSLNIRHVAQPFKGYPRDITTLWDNPGRVKVDYTDGQKKQLLKELAERITLLPGRVERLRKEAAEAEISHVKAQEEEARERHLQQQQTKQRQLAASKTNNKKKSNKKK